MPRHGVHVLLALSFALVVDASAQILTPKPAAAEHVIVATGVEPDTVRPGAKATLWVDVAPKPNIHVYAAGAKGFQPVSVFTATVAGITLEKPKYPPSERFVSPGTTEPVPVYTKPFRIARLITVGRDVKSGQMLNVAGALTYESCDDRLCYPASSIPITWVVKIR